MKTTMLKQAQPINISLLKYNILQGSQEVISNQNLTTLPMTDYKITNKLISKSGTEMIVRRF